MYAPPNYCLVFPQTAITLTVCRLVGNWTLPGTRTAQNGFLLVGLFMNARFAIQ
jgi:hypothetical protein